MGFWHHLDEVRIPQSLNSVSPNHGNMSGKLTWLRYSVRGRSLLKMAHGFGATLFGIFYGFSAQNGIGTLGSWFDLVLKLQLPFNFLSMSRRQHLIQINLAQLLWPLLMGFKESCNDIYYYVTMIISRHLWNSDMP